MRIAVISTVRFGRTGIGMVINNIYNTDAFDEDIIYFYIPDNSDKSLVQELQDNNKNVVFYASSLRRRLIGE